MGFKEWLKKRGIKTADHETTKAAELTLRQSIYPICLVTVLFFLWGFSYGLLDTLNKHFQNQLGIDKARSAGLQAAYFGLVESAVDDDERWSR
jgi:MFS transporter, FHS family, L-fucose permease